MNKILILITIFTTSMLTGCFEPKEKGVKGQAYVSLGDKYRGQALVDFPVYCYTEEFDAQLSVLRVRLIAELERFQDEIDAYYDAIRMYLVGNVERQIAANEQQLAQLESSKGSRMQSAEDARKYELDALNHAIENLKNQIQAAETRRLQRAGLASVLQPFVDEQRILLDQGYANIERELKRANELIDQINQTIVDQNIALSPMDNLSSKIGKRSYSDVASCWTSFSALLSKQFSIPTYPSTLSADVARSDYDPDHYHRSRGFFAPRSEFADHIEYSDGLVCYAAEKGTGLRNFYYAPLSAKLTPFLESEIKEAYYKHHLLAKPDLRKIVVKLQESQKAAGDALLVWANKAGVTRGEAGKIISSSIDVESYASEIRAKQNKIKAVTELDLLAMIETELKDQKSLIVEQHEVLAGRLKSLAAITDYPVIEEFNQLDESELDRIKKSLTRDGIVRPQLDLQSVDLDDESILGVFSSECDTVVHTDLNGEFLIPQGTTRIFAVLQEDDDYYLWMEAIAEASTDVRIAISTVTASKLTDLIADE